MEFYRGKGIGGFGGVGLVNQQNQTYQYLVTTAPTIAKLGTIGGWSQLKARINVRNEFNFAAGYGGFNSANLRNAAGFDSSLLFVPARNESMLAKCVFKPRSDLVFSLEYRRLKTYNVNDEPIRLTMSVQRQHSFSKTMRSQFACLSLVVAFAVACVLPGSSADGYTVTADVKLVRSDNKQPVKELSKSVIWLVPADGEFHPCNQRESALADDAKG